MTHAELVAAGYPLSPVGHARLTAYVNALLAENTRVNLTGARDAATLWRKHVRDSLALWPPLQAAGARRLLDLGAGGGLPGLVLACVVPDLEVTLLDATRKKVAALDRIITTLQLLNVRAIAARAEQLSHDPTHRAQYDAVAVRAVAALDVLLEWSSGFLRIDGEAWFFKSASQAQREPHAAATVAAARACGFDRGPDVVYRLPDEPDERILLNYRKTRPLPPHLPRRH